MLGKSLDHVDVGCTYSTPKLSSFSLQVKVIITQDNSEDILMEAVYMYE